MIQMFNPALLQNRLRQHLQRSNLSARELERKAGLKESAVRNILDGKSQTPTIRTLLAICIALECKVEDLVKDHPNTTSTNSDHPTKWLPVLSVQCLEAINKYFEEFEISPTTQEAFHCFQEIYDYNLNNGRDTVDRKFTKWFIQKQFLKI